jgi:hypothetical protein
MQRIEISIKASGSEPLALVFAASDTPEALADRLRIVTWLVGQLDGHTESRRRASRAERTAPSALSEPPAEA